jgi:hypothetical protein
VQFNTARAVCGVNEKREIIPMMTKHVNLFLPDPAVSCDCRGNGTLIAAVVFHGGEQANGARGWPLVSW